MALSSEQKGISTTAGTPSCHATSMGDPASTDCTFDELYSRYVGQVYRQCLSMTHDSEEARDFTQDIFIKVLDKLDSFQQRSSLSTWINAIAFNYCADQIKRAKRLPTQMLDVDHDNYACESDEALEDRTRLAYQALASLSEREQVLVRQKYEQGLSLEEMAQLHQIGVSALKMRLKRCREKISRYCSCNTYDKH